MTASDYNGLVNYLKQPGPALDEVVYSHSRGVDEEWDFHAHLARDEDNSRSMSIESRAQMQDRLDKLPLKQRYLCHITFTEMILPYWDRLVEVEIEKRKDVEKASHVELFIDDCVDLGRKLVEKAYEFYNGTCTFLELRDSEPSADFSYLMAPHWRLGVGEGWNFKNLLRAFRDLTADSLYNPVYVDENRERTFSIYEFESIFREGGEDPVRRVEEWWNRCRSRLAFVDAPTAELQ